MVGNATSIDATIVRGLGSTAECIGLQIPCLKKYVPGIEKCHVGSINLRLDQPLRILNPDVTTPPITWAGPSYATEVFSLQSIEFEYPIGGQCYAAWIYIPHNSPHSNDLFRAEILAASIPGMKILERCRIHIPKTHRLEPTVVI
jgi:hypothetical protein